MRCNAAFCRRLNGCSCVPFVGYMHTHTHAHSLISSNALKKKREHGVVNRRGGGARVERRLFSRTGVADAEHVYVRVTMIARCTP
jgi:hypothetical protein